MNRTYGFFTMLAVIGVSIVFGMIVGGRLNSPEIVLAAPQPALLDAAPSTPVAPAMSASGRLDFADIAEIAIPAVVSITSIQVSAGGESGAPQDFFHRFFFRNDEEDDDSGTPRGRRSNTSGSGFLISEDGFILSNNHVVEDSERLTVVLQTGERYDAVVVGTDPAIDLALLKIDAGSNRLPYLPLGDSDRLRVGEWVIAIGNPLDFNHSVTVGVVSAKDRHVPLDGTDYAVAAFIQTDAAINLGNSGGPLLNADGEVVGINTAINRTGMAEGIGFALQINDAKQARDQLLESGRVRRGILGVSMAVGELDEEAARYYRLPDRNGVLIREVTDDSPADLAGIRPEDIIRKVDGRPIVDSQDLLAEIASRRPGDRVELEFYREGRTIVRTATLAERRIDQFGRAFIGTNADEPQATESKVELVEGLGMEVETYDRDALPEALRERADPDLRGVIVEEVLVNSPAMDKGVTRDTIIVSLNDRPVRTVEEWQERLAGLEPGSAVKLETRRFDGQLDRLIFLSVPE